MYIISNNIYLQLLDMEKRNREESAVYWIPWTYEDLMKHTKEIKDQEWTEVDERTQYEEWFIYLPQKGASFGEAKAYTDRIVKGELVDILS